MVLTAPSSAPENVQGYNTSSSSIRVTWANVAAVHQNGIIVSYRVSYQAVGGSFRDGGKKDKQVAGASNQADLTGLEANVDYNITVLASTSAGEGPSSSYIVVKTAEAGKKLSFGLFWYLFLMVGEFENEPGERSGFWSAFFKLH